MDWALQLALLTLSISLLVAFVQLLRAETLPDRVIVLDFVAYLTMGVLGTYAILRDEAAYLDAALVLGLLAFLGTLGLARYIERERTTHEEPDR